ncbi:MAG: desulfoferrodoxin [Clostridiaceae bacterium]|nr:desulfoferrodoxin [Clostridiaceae bacterium]
MAGISFYRCDKCGNIVALLQKGGGTLTCCDQSMTELKANTTDASKEKHVPDIVKEDDKIKVTIGSTPHPMIPEHYIQWIALVSGEKVQFKFLRPEDEPKAEFLEADSGTVYEYCNLHGLWKADF